MTEVENIAAFVLCYVCYHYASAAKFSAYLSNFTAVKIHTFSNS